ncbi:Mitochondria-eating protein [Acropora cervicornis]|uniref:Mitochondria-eating protein n=1 Tax=Acropora cervicornis TaxID=6130 RepID=A0AAD9VFM8_ACRCE|nr:Mitochondria-eating protein [Acropora cervicornis]
MSNIRGSLSRNSPTSRQRYNCSRSFAEDSLNNALHTPRKANRERRRFETKSSKTDQDPLEDGKILVLKVIGKINLRIERKEYQDLTRIVNQIPGDVVVLILDNLLIESLYADIPSSLTSLAAIYSKIWHDSERRRPDYGCTSDEFVHHLARYFADDLKYNSQTFASACSRDHIKTIFQICTQMDGTLHARVKQTAEQFSNALNGFTEHTNSSEAFYIKIHEALKSELKRTVSYYKSALEKLADTTSKFPKSSSELSWTPTRSRKKADLESKTTQYPRAMSGQSLEERLYFNQSLLSAVQINSRDKLLINDLIEELEKRIDHDKIVLQLLQQLGQEFNVSRDERVLPLLERFHHGYHLVLQLLEESQKGMTTKPQVPTITHTVASGSESGDVSEEGSDVFDTVTQLDDETGKEYMLFCESGKPTNANFSALTTDPSLSESEYTQAAESKERVTKNDTTQQKTDENSNLQRQLSEKQKELEAAQKMVKYLKERERNLTDRLQDQAQRQLKKGGKFEDLSAGECRPSALIERYDNLFSQTRLDAMDKLDEVESLNQMDDSGNIKNKILFSVLVVAHRTVQHSLAEKHRKLKKLLDIPNDEGRAEHVRDLQDRITDYFRRTGAKLKVDSIRRDVSKQLWTTLYDFPELQECSKLKEYMNECVRLSWMLAVQVPPMSIEYEATEFTDKLQGRSMTSDMTKSVIKYHVWPALIDAQTGHVLYKGTVVT